MNRDDPERHRSSPDLTGRVHEQEVRVERVSGDERRKEHPEVDKLSPGPGGDVCRDAGVVVQDGRDRHHGDAGREVVREIEGLRLLLTDREVLEGGADIGHFRLRRNCVENLEGVERLNVRRVGIHHNFSVDDEERSRIRIRAP